MNENLLLLLKQQLKLLEDAVNVLTFSGQKCREIGIEDGYTPGELD